MVRPSAELLKNKSVAYVAWAPYNRRAESFARAMDASLHLIHFFHYQSPIWAPIKYPLMAVQTLHVLFKKRPRVVFAMSPPLFCAFFVYLYCTTAKSSLVMDVHTGSLISSPWTWFRPLHRFLCRQSKVSIVTSKKMLKLVHSWKCNAVAMNPPVFFPDAKVSTPGKSIRIMVVNSFSSDEPLDDILEAAGQIPEVKFFVTGNTAKASPADLANRPKNVHFTGFLPRIEYFRLLKEVDAVLCMTTRDHTLLSGGEEALFMGKPLITTDFPILKDFFGSGAVYVFPDADRILKGIRFFLANRRRMSHAMDRQKRRHLARWETNKWILINILEGSS